MGDPAGIGPEIIVKAAVAMRERIESGRLALQVVGSAQALARAQSQLDLPAASRLLTAVDVGPVEAPVVTGQVSAAGGEWAYRAVERAVGLTQDGLIDAIVTAPLSKEALHLAGHHFEGHTELLAHLTGQRDAVMMLAHEAMRAGVGEAVMRSPWIGTTGTRHR
jgi:4-hydroxythreonine-4-phosphate dehydrogenase